MSLTSLSPSLTGNDLERSLGWSRDTRDNLLFTTRGMLQSAYAELGVGDLQYYKTNYLIQWFTPLPLDTVKEREIIQAEFADLSRVLGGGAAGKLKP